MQNYRSRKDIPENLDTIFGWKKRGKSIIKGHLPVAIFVGKNKKYDLYDESGVAAIRGRSSVKIYPFDAENIGMCIAFLVKTARKRSNTCVQQEEKGDTIVARRMESQHNNLIILVTNVFSKLEEDGIANVSDKVFNKTLKLKDVKATLQAYISSKKDNE